MPTTSYAQDSAKHRQKTKNEWRNIGGAAAAIGALGLIKGNSTMTALGLGGALYSASRYEHDRKSQSKMERSRAQAIRRGYYYERGHKYVKRTVWKNGHKYYKFVRS